ncbi:MAG: regulatory protein RecX [Ideonella sp.]|nr:regulatory protein RecX [Ideonella sp.]
MVNGTGPGRAPAAAGARAGGGRPSSLKARAIQWLSQREHSRSELRAKLLRAQRSMLRVQALHPERAGDVEASGKRSDDVAPLPALHEVDTLLDWLAAEGYLSEARFVESRVHARQARFGNQRIRHELQQHGLALDAHAQEALSASELQRARAVWHRKFGPASAAVPLDAAARAKQMRFLAGRGFTAEVIRQVFRGALDDDEA